MAIYSNLLQLGHPSNYGFQCPVPRILWDQMRQCSSWGRYTKKHCIPFKVIASCVDSVGLEIYPGNICIYQHVSPRSAPLQEAILTLESSIDADFVWTELNKCIIWKEYLQFSVRAQFLHVVYLRFRPWHGQPLMMKKSALCLGVWKTASGWCELRINELS